MGVRSRKTKRRGGRGGGMFSSFNLFKSSATKKAKERDDKELEMVIKGQKMAYKDEFEAKKEWGEHYGILYWISKALHVIKEDKESGVSFKLANARLEAVKKLWADSPSKKSHSGSSLNLMRLQNVYANAVNPRLNEGKPIGKLSNFIDGIIISKGQTVGPEIRETAIQAINNYMFYLMIDDIEKTFKQDWGQQLGTGVDNSKYHLFISHPNMIEDNKMHGSCRRRAIGACENKLDQLLIAVERKGLAIILDKGEFSVVGSSNTTLEDREGSDKLAGIKDNNILQHTDYKDRISNFKKALNKSGVEEDLINEIETYFEKRRNVVINTVISDETAYLSRSTRKYVSYMSGVAKGRPRLAYDKSWLASARVEPKVLAQVRPSEDAEEDEQPGAAAQPDDEASGKTGGGRNRRTRRTRRTRRRGGGVRKRTVSRRRVRRSRR